MKRAYKVLIKGVLCLSRPPTGCTLHQPRLLDRILVACLGPAIEDGGCWMCPEYLYSGL